MDGILIHIFTHWTCFPTHFCLYRRDSALSLHHPLLPILDIYSFSRGDDTYPLQVVANAGARTGTDRLDVTGHQFHRPVAGEFQHRVADVLALGFVASPCIMGTGKLIRFWIVGTVLVIHV